MEEAATIGSASAGAPAGDVSVRLDGVSKHFGAFVAVDAVDLDVGRGEFFSLLGPSGSGKTTCLRLIAGFEQPDDGAIEVHGVNVAGVPPYALCLLGTVLFAVATFLLGTFVVMRRSARDAS